MNIYKRKPFGIFKKDIAEYSKRRVDDIIEKLNNLQCTEVKYGVIEAIINDNYNFNLYFEGKTGKGIYDAEGNWEDMNLEINNLLGKYIKTETTDLPNGKPDGNKTKKKKVEDFLTCSCRREVMELMHEKLDNRGSGVYVAYFLEALERKGYLQKGARIVPAMIEEFGIKCVSQAINNNRGVRRSAKEIDVINRIMEYLP